MPLQGRPRPPRVLFLLEAPEKNGAVLVTYELARQWAAWGTRLLLLHRPEERSATPPHEVALTVVAGQHRRLRRALVPATPRLVGLARRHEVVVGVPEIGLGLLFAALLARLARRPLVVAVHADLDQALDEYMPRASHRVFRWVHRHAAGAVCVDEALVAPLVRNGLAEDRIRVVQNGIDPAAVLRASRLPGSRVTGDLPVVVATGRLAPQKGYDLLLQAHARVVRRLPHRVLILNDGSERASLEALAAELDVTATVEFAGADVSPHPSVAAAYAFCLPSRHEGLPLSLLEALVLGAPVIAADCSQGVRAALDSGRVGELVPAEDVDALADALARHLEDPAPLRARAALGPAHARSYDDEAMADGWARALSELLHPAPEDRTVPPGG